MLCQIEGNLKETLEIYRTFKFKCDPAERDNLTFSRRSGGAQRSELLVAHQENNSDDDQGQERKGESCYPQIISHCCQPRKHEREK